MRLSATSKALVDRLANADDEAQRQLAKTKLTRHIAALESSLATTDTAYQAAAARLRKVARVGRRDRIQNDQQLTSLRRRVAST